MTMTRLRHLLLRQNSTIDNQLLARLFMAPTQCRGGVYPRPQKMSQPLKNIKN